jgi:hypothetical protein
MRRGAVAAALALGLAPGCGDSVNVAEVQRQQAFRALCESLPGASTLGQAIQGLPGLVAEAADCAAQQYPLKGGVDRCPYGQQNQHFCSDHLISVSRDPSQCGSPPFGGCCFWCEVRVPDTAGQIADDAPVCGSRFIDRQPCPF